MTVNELMKAIKLRLDQNTKESLKLNSIRDKAFNYAYFMAIAKVLELMFPFIPNYDIDGFEVDDYAIKHNDKCRVITAYIGETSEQVAINLKNAINYAENLYIITNNSGKYEVCKDI